MIAQFADENFKLKHTGPGTLCEDTQSCRQLVFMTDDV